MKLILLGFTVAAILSCVAGDNYQPSSRPDPLKYFTQEDIERGRAYRRTGYTIFFVQLAVVVALLLILIYSGAARRADAIITARISSYPLRVLVFFVLMFVIYLAVTFPLSYYRSFIVEHEYGFSRQTLGEWAGDYLKGGGISLVIGASLAVGFYWLMKASPRWWWLFALGAFAAYVGMFILLKPVLIDPVFNRFMPLQDEEMKTEVIGLAQKAGIEVGEVLVMDASRRTSHTNAYFTGFGRTKRIVLYDTLVENHSKREILSVVAHEIGHWKHAHIYKGFFMGLVGTLIVFLVIKSAGTWLTGRMPLGTDTLASPATIPLVFLIIYVCSVVGMPLENAISRTFERQSDRTALELTGDGETFIKMQVGIARANASDLVPSALFYYWFYSHPSTMERIEAAEKYGG